MSLRWDEHFIHIVGEHAKMSKDPSTQIGAVLVGPDREVLSMGFNGFPRGVDDNKFRLEDRTRKYPLMVHAEMNAVLAAARNGITLKGCSLYLNSPWGGPPCIRCVVELIQAGIVEVVSTEVMEIPERWKASLQLSLQILAEAKITYREIKYAWYQRPFGR
jgi:dCMP deaminase